MKVPKAKQLLAQYEIASALSYPGAVDIPPMEPRDALVAIITTLLGVVCASLVGIVVLAERRH
jgi:hypothetical protein